MSKDIKVVPLIIPTLCRYKHFVKCIESLKKNLWAVYTDVYIALDFPKQDNQYEGYREICTYLENGDFSCFHSFEVIKRENNLGPFINEEKAIDFILDKYDCFIRTDDDTEFSPCFLEYMHNALCKYEDDETVVAVTGYSYPCEYVVSGTENVFKENFFVPMWGTGFWRDKYYDLKKKITEEYVLHKEFDKLLRVKKYRNLIDARFYDFVDAGLSWQKDKLVFKFTDIAIATYVGLHDKYIIYPIMSMVRNNGFDGSGFTCLEMTKDSFSEQKIEENKTVTIIEGSMKCLEKNRNIVNKHDTRSLSFVLRIWLKVIIYKIIGRRHYKSIWFNKNKNKYCEFIND